MSYYKTIKDRQMFRGGGSAITFTPVIPGQNPKTEAWKKAEDAANLAAYNRKNTAINLAWAERQAAKKAAAAEDAAFRASLVPLDTPSGNIAAAEATKKAQEKAGTVKAAGAEKAAVKSPAKPRSVPTVRKETPKEARTKYIQRRLGVKADGIWGPKTEAAYKAMQETQRSLGFTGKDIDGIRGDKTTAAIAQRDATVREAIAPIATKTTPIDRVLPMTFARQPLSNREMRQDARQIRRTERRDERELRRQARQADDVAVANAVPGDEFDIRRRGGIFYNTID